MSNNNHLALIAPIASSFQNPSNQKNFGESSQQANFKDKEFFLKSQVSLADTTCDQNSPIFHKFQDITTDEQSFSLTEFNLEDSHCSMEDDLFCNEFIENGFCMKGVECAKIHNKIKENSNQIEDRCNQLKFILEQIPEMLFVCKRRTRWFMA